MQSSFSNITIDAMIPRRMGSNHRKIKRDFEKFKADDHEDLKKNQCAFFKEKGHWKVDYSKLKPKKKEPRSEDNIAQAHNDSDSDSFGYSLSIAPIYCCSKESERILDMGATHHVCPKREWFVSLKNQIQAW